MPHSDKDSPSTADRQHIDQLREQARSAAEQAIEFAKLSQEQAKLARDLNAQVRLLTGAPPKPSRPQRDLCLHIADHPCSPRFKATLTLKPNCLPRILLRHLQHLRQVLPSYSQQTKHFFHKRTL